NLGNLLAKLGKTSDAEQEFRKALIMQEELAASYPAVAGYRQRLLWMHSVRATSRINTGKITDAIVEVAELEKSSDGSAEDWYNLACVYGVASGKSTQKKQEYGDRAMELLNKAVKAGFDDAAHMRRDTDLDALRDRNDFKKLLAELTASRGA